MVPTGYRALSGRGARRSAPER